MIRLLETEVKLRCKAEDVQMVKGLIPEVQKEYSEFMKKETGEDTKVTIEVVDHVPLEKADTE